MFNDDEGMALVDELLENAEEPFNIGLVQPGSRFIEQEEGGMLSAGKWSATWNTSGTR
ncbi:MAG: hypothetical protein R6V45_09095 [Oceanipulchritudo sp.]